MDYAEFLERKTGIGVGDGFEPLWMPDFLYGFQSHLTEWAVRQGRAAIFADCGLGKTPMQLVWAENVRRHTGKPVLILTPLAVASQSVEEAEKFGVDAARSSDGTVHKCITVTNYHRLHYFKPDDFGGVVCDESSILKSFNGKYRQDITTFMKRVPYRLLATATAAPNDYTEFGTSSEALGYLGHVDMLNRFFVNDLNNSAQGRAWGGVLKWRFKGHAQESFWRWVCSWARACRKPSDLGFEDEAFNLPTLTEVEHLVNSQSAADGRLFDVPAHGMQEEREEIRRTVDERCEVAASVANATTDPVVVWCHYNNEGDILTKAIPGAEQVKGSDSPESKESRLLAFSRGEVRVLVTKPKIGAWGLNWQHCNRVIYFPSHSYEQYYQAIRRCWRFGQTRPVTVDVVTTNAGKNMLRSLRRKSSQADQMFTSLVRHMNRSLAVKIDRKFHTQEDIPTWL